MASYAPLNGPQTGAHQDEPNKGELNQSYRPVSGTPRSKLWLLVYQLGIFYVAALTFMGGHLILFLSLNGRPVQDTIFSQGIQGALSNFMAIMAEMLLVAGCGVAYTQIVWRTIRHRTITAHSIDKLLTLAQSPWNLFRLSVLRHARVELLVGLSCFLIPIAAMFPPGALTVEFRNNIRPVILKDVPTLNLSDWGDGTFKSFMDHALFEADGDANVREAQLRLSSVAAAVLSLGEPVPLQNPCGGPCSYALAIDGPRFNCRNVTVNETAMNPSNSLDRMFSAWDRSNHVPRDRGYGYVFETNSFQVTWRVGTVSSSEGWRNLSSRTIDCAVAMATYEFGISNEEDGTRNITRDILNEREIWTSNKPIQAHFYSYWFDSYGPQTYEPPRQQEELTASFTNTQAYMLSRAATGILSGDIEIERAMFALSGNELPVGSPYTGLTGRNEMEVIFTPEKLQEYLEDVILSAISLNPTGEPLWANSNDVEAYEGAGTYIFDPADQPQFYGAYAACLVASALIYAVGIWNLWRNGAPAGDSFLQYATALSTSRTLHRRGEACSASRYDAEAERELRQTEVRLGTFRPVTSNDDADGGKTGFGTEQELEPCSRRRSHPSTRNLFRGIRGRRRGITSRRLSEHSLAGRPRDR